MPETPETPRRSRSELNRYSMLTQLTPVPSTPVREYRRTKSSSSRHPPDSASDLLMTCSSSASRSKRHVLPAQFRQEMPTSARKSKVDSSDSDTPKVECIRGSSFYGTSQSKSRSLEKSETFAPVREVQSAKVISKKRKRSLGNRSTSTSSLKKTKKIKKSIYGFNKGVGHSIKPPKISKTPKSADKKADTVATTPKSEKKEIKNQKLFKLSPGRMGNLTPTVDFVLRHGQPQFIRRRRSPRKVEPRSNLNRKNPKLFSPCTSKDFLNPSPGSSPNRSKTQIPSPVKFDVKDDDHEEDMNVSGLIDKLDQGSEEHVVYASEEEYDEINKIAEEAAMEMEELNYSGLELSGGELRYTDVVSSPIRTPKKSQLESVTTPIRRSARNTPSKNSPIRRTPRKCSDITPVKNVAKDKENMISSSPMMQLCLSDVSSPRDNRSHLFSVFRKEAKTGLGEKSPVVTPTKQPRKPFKNRMDDSQMIIDAGQKEIGTVQCKTCQFVYHVGDPEDEHMHQKQHDGTLDTLISFPGWKNERIVRTDPLLELRVLCVKHGDPKYHLVKAKSALKVVDDFLGVSTGIRQPNEYRLYLAVIDKVVCGVLLAEPLLPGDHLANSYLKDGHRVVSDDLEGFDQKKLVGVSRIWVHQKYQRKKIAFHLMEAMRCDFCFPAIVEKNNIALSHTSEMGSAFATYYFASNTFLVYRQA